MMCNYYLDAPHRSGLDATGARYLLEGATRANDQGSGKGSHLPGILGNPWDPLAALLPRLTSRLVWPPELAMLNGQPGKHGGDKLLDKGAWS